MAQSNTDRIENASEQVGRAAGYADQATDAAKEYAAQVADRIAAVAREAYDDPQRFMRETQRDVTRQAQQNPAADVGHRYRYWLRNWRNFEEVRLPWPAPTNTKKRRTCLGRG